MTYLRRLFEAYPFHTLEPDESFLVDAPESGGERGRGIRAQNKTYAFVYTPYGKPFTVDKSIIQGERVREIWFDPRYGVSHHIHTSDNVGFQTYTPPTSGRGIDWVLILDDAGKNYDAP